MKNNRVRIRVGARERVRHRVSRRARVGVQVRARVRVRSSVRVRRREHDSNILMHRMERIWDMYVGHKHFFLSHNAERAKPWKKPCMRQT